MRKFLTVFFPFPRDYDLSSFSKVKIMIDDDDLENATAYLLHEGEGPYQAPIKMTIPMIDHHTDMDGNSNYIFDNTKLLPLYTEYQQWCVQMSEDIKYTLQEWAKLPDETRERYKDFLHNGEAKGLEEFPYSSDYYL